MRIVDEFNLKIDLILMSIEEVKYNQVIMLFNNYSVFHQMLIVLFQLDLYMMEIFMYGIGKIRKNLHQINVHAQ